MPASARFCGATSRQRAHRAREAAKLPKAHQRVVKDRQPVNEDPASLDIRRAIVRPIGLSEAGALLAPYEKRPLAISRFALGLYFGDRLGGAVVYGDEYAENLGVWDKYGFTGRIICLQRGACLPWAHPHSASALIRRSMSLLPGRYDVVTATVDRSFGEIGVVYQAAGFTYVGTMRKSTRVAIALPDGTQISERQAYSLVGARGIQALGRMGFYVGSVPRKERYFAFRGSSREQREARAAIAHLVKPYPRRA
jgi:hypothetical protein